MNNFLFSEAVLGAGGSRDDWQELQGAGFRYGLAAVAKAPGARVKWNVEGRQFALWSPRGPQFGKAQVKVDGRVLADLDLHAEQLAPWKFLLEESAPEGQPPCRRADCNRRPASGGFSGSDEMRGMNECSARWPHAQVVANVSRRYLRCPENAPTDGRVAQVVPW